MKKFLLPTCATLTAMVLLSGQVTVLAQRGQAAVRRAQRRMEQLGRPGKRPNLGGPPIGRLPNPNNPKRAKQLQRQQLMETLGLTPDQRQRMGEIQRSNEDEAISVGRRVRQARNALDRAIMSPNFDEALVRRHTEELAAAQADQVRFQARMRAKMRSVLTADQVLRLHQLEQERRQKMREQNRELDKEDTPPQNRPPGL